jgi:hypothetical protein
VNGDYRSLSFPEEMACRQDLRRARLPLPGDASRLPYAALVLAAVVLAIAGVM